MKRYRTSMSMGMILALAMALPAFGDEVPLPESAMTDDTTLAVWFDAEQFTPEAVRQAADRINAALPEGMRQTREQLDAQLDEAMAGFRPGHEAFTGAGGEGLLMLVRAAEPDEEPVDPVMLIRVAEGTAPDQLGAAMAEFADEPEETDLAEYADGWLVPVDELEAVPTDGTAENTAAFSNYFEQTEAAPIRLGFRMNPSMREQLAELERQQQAEGQMQGPNPGAALLSPAKHIAGGWGTVTLGEDPAFRPVIQFDDAESAERFRSAWEQLLFMGQQMFMMQFAQPNVPDAPEPESIEALFQSLALEREDELLSGTIGSEFITRLGEIAPALEPLLMQMMMGAMGQQQQPPMLPQQPQQQQQDQPQGPPPPPQQ